MLKSTYSFIRDGYYYNDANYFTAMIYYDDTVLYTKIKELEVIKESALEELYKATQEQHIPLSDLLIDGDYISDENLGKIIADIHNTKFTSLANLAVPPEVFKLIPQAMAKAQKMVAFQRDDTGVHIAMADPSNIEALDLLKRKIGQPLIVSIATERDIQKTLALYAVDRKAALEELISRNATPSSTNPNNIIDPPVIEMVNAMLLYAVADEASDIHIEPMKEYTRIRFRVDGILHDITTLPSVLQQRIMLRIKVLAQLRTDEMYAPQDGKFSYSFEDVSVDVRVSILPSAYGENIVMRLLGYESHRFTLSDLGFLEENLQSVREAYKKPFGIILSTGPTGSGKTTTMYAILKLLNSKGINIMTIEDPIEENIDGVIQIQVNQKTNLTFANGLRSILRQDPNIILVGEIRDNETADIALNSALTGHLVLSTLHTNTAATAIPRLLEMGTEPFLISSSVNLIIAQRLLRKIDPHCRVSKEIALKDYAKVIDEQLLKKIFGDRKTINLYQGKGCDACHGTGYRMRIGMFEVLRMDAEIGRAILDKKDAATIEQIALKNGMIPMIEDGLLKVSQGLTTIEEVISSSMHND